MEQEEFRNFTEYFKQFYTKSRKCSEGKTVKFQATHWRNHGVGPELCADGIVRNVRHPGICTCSCDDSNLYRFTDLQIYRFINLQIH